MPDYPKVTDEPKVCLDCEARWMQPRTEKRPCWACGSENVSSIISLNWSEVPAQASPRPTPTKPIRSEWT